MSSQKGNVARSRPQRHQNTFSFKNDKFDKSVQTKKINAKLHDGVCQRCKEVLEWRVKYSKYKPLSKPKKCTPVGKRCTDASTWSTFQNNFGTLFLEWPAVVLLSLMSSKCLTLLISFIFG
ncbi:uncharacterized protein C9orf85 homolog isoform 2-T2 [Hipposideros larvatus]